MKRSLEVLVAQVVKQLFDEPARLHLVLVPTDNDALIVEECVRQMAGVALEQNEVVSLPNFIQSGVYRFESSRRLLARRLGALHRIRTGGVRCVIASAPALMRVVPSATWLGENTLFLREGDEHDQDIVWDRLQALGYQTVQRVEEVGECAVRGGILDLWTPGERHPVRCEFFGDTVEKIRSFRPADQRSFATLAEVSVLPAREFVWPVEAHVSAWIDRFNKAILAQGLPGTLRNDLLENVRCSIPFPGIDDLSQLFSSTEFVRPLDFFRQNHDRAVAIHLLAETPQLEQGFKEVFDLYESAWQSAYGKAFLTIKPEKLFPAADAFAGWLKEQTAVENKSPYALPQQVESRFLAAGKRKFSERIQLVKELLNEDSQLGCVFTSASRDACLEFAALLRAQFAGTSKVEVPEADIPAFSLKDFFTKPMSSAAELWQARLARFGQPFYLPDSRQLVLPEEWLRGVSKDHSLEVFSEEESRNASREATETLLTQHFGDFSEGDLVVHVQHGIARFRGLMTIKLMDISGDFLVLEYAGNDKIYVPVHKLNMVQRYIGAGKADESLLDSLKSSQWEKRKTRAKEEAQKLAKELLEHQARRATTPGHAYATIEDNYMLFEAAFPYDETPDQLKATREIQADMSRPKAMDRLLCGDVGFGKTEVAMRAAYRAVLDGKQVAWLVPTTVLAHQHHRSLKERFQQFGVQVEILDRSSGTGGATKLLKKLSEGGVDVLVGTHRLLSPDVKYRDLGLLIVDEEQRFGVLQKEKIKTLSF